ncbi:MAG: hypothetical protein PVF33_05720, partial [Candidatus Latescibacterota bacterium]
MKPKSCIIALLVVAVWTTSAAAQYRKPPVRQMSQPMLHTVEITPWAGYAWTFARRVNYVNATGDLDIGDSPVWGVEVDVNLHPGAQLVLLYSRQDSDLSFKSGGVTHDVTDMSVEYFQIGGIGGVKQGNVLPFGMFTLGATRAAFKDLPAADDLWKFSVILALGAKFYPTDRFGLRVQATLPWTMMSGGA